ncbi:single-stranded DNA-binding protein [Methyloglobulus sp.]|uniref:single-stranded DNA-binding protein n=1 Tax=Methyloglobulus sp. TaxID=2518622 RepID=UPI0032B87B48
MIDALISGKLIKQPELKASQNGKPYTNFLLSVSIGEAESIVISGIAFGVVAERIAKLGKGDALAVSGSLKPTTWEKDGETKHGLSLTVSDALSVYDISKKRRKPDTPDNSTHQGTYQPPASYGKPHARPYDDELNF